MPTYQYACTSCGEQLEVVQKFSDEPLTVCPACSGRLRKVFSAVGVVFKGSGFYKTDSRAGSTKKPSESGDGTKAPDKSSDKSTGSSSSGDKSSTPSKDSGTSSSSGSSGSSSSGQVA